MNPYPLHGNRFRTADTSSYVWLRHGESLLFKWLKENRLKKQKKNKPLIFLMKTFTFVHRQIAFWFYPALYWFPSPSPPKNNFLPNGESQREGLLCHRSLTGFDYEKQQNTQEWIKTKNSQTITMKIVVIDSHVFYSACYHKSIFNKSFRCRVLI